MCQGDLGSIFVELLLDSKNLAKVSSKRRRKSDVSSKSRSDRSRSASPGYLILSYLITLPYLTLPYFTLPYLTLPYLIVSYLIFSYLYVYAYVGGLRFAADLSCEGGTMLPTSDVSPSKIPGLVPTAHVIHVLLC